MTATKYPETYLWVEECRSGETWIMPIGDDEPLDLENLIEKWADQTFGGELELDGKTMPRLQGNYYAKVLTNGRPPDSGVVWVSGGFYLKSTYE